MGVLGEASSPASAAISGALAALQLLLLFSSTRAYFSLPRDRDDFYLLIPRLGCALLFVVLVITLSVYAMTPKPNVNEASCMGSLRTIYTAQTEFARSHPQNGFAASLSQLGPSPGAELIDYVLASGTKSGYKFSMTSTTSDTGGHVVRYIVSARPIRYRRGNERSFLLDETGTIHYTTEDRAATAQDPALP